MTSTPVAIALGSNLGDRQRYLIDAIAELSTVVDNLTPSTWIETEPLDVGPQPLFLNGVAVGETHLSARDLLAELMRIEQKLGRQRVSPGAARTIDLDLIWYGDAIINEPELVVPHPRFRARRFVLEPLASVAATWVDPVTDLTVKELLRRLAD